MLANDDDASGDPRAVAASGDLRLEDDGPRVVTDAHGHGDRVGGFDRPSVRLER
jgi:hypothetical protein